MIPSLLFLAALGLATQTADAQPIAVLSESILEFGTMARGETTTRTFTLENRGTAPLEIRHVRNNCACTVLDVPSEIAPGAKAELTLRLDTETLTGPASTVLNLFTNDPAAPRLDITVRVESRPYVWADPPELRYIVHRYFEGSGSARAKVAGANPSEFRILDIESPYPFLTLTHREALPEERQPGPGSQYVIESNLDPAAPVGPLEGWVRVTTDHEKQKKLSIAVSGFVRPLLHVTPPEAKLEGVEPGDEPLRWSHHVRNFATETITIERTESDIAGLEIAVRPGRHDHEFYVDLVLPPSALRQSVLGAVKLHTTSAKAPIVQIPVWIEVKE
jgi:hypothetical protein